MECVLGISKKVYIVILGVIICVVGILFQANSVSASSLSLTLSNNHPQLNLPKNAFGATSITASVQINASTPYTLSAAASNDTSGGPITGLTASNGSTIPTLSSAVSLPLSGSSISDSSNFPATQWGIGVSNGSSVTFSPLSSDLTLKESSITSGTETTDIYFGVHTGTADINTYSNTIIIPAIISPITYTLNYNANGGTGAPANASYDSIDDSYTYTVSSTAPTRSEYRFLGWNEGSAIPDYSIGDDTSSLSLIQPGGTVTLTAASPSTTLYAVWQAISGDVIEEVTNPDGSVTITTTTYGSDGNPTEKTIATTDTSGNVSTQEITYVNGAEVVTGYTIDTSDNPNGVLELDGTDSIDTGVIAFDGNDFTINLTAKFNMNNISGNANPVVAFRDYTNGGCMVNIHNRSVTWMNEDNTSSVTTGDTLSFGFTRYTGGSSTSGSYYFRWINPRNSSYYTYGTGVTEKQLKIVIQSRSNVVSAYIYNDSGTLVAQPGSTTTIPLTFDFSSATNLNDITVVLGYFNQNGTDRYTKFDIVDFSVEKTISSP